MGHLRTFVAEYYASRHSLRTGFLALALIAARATYAAPSGTSALTVLPISRHSQLLTYGLFSEEQTALLYRDAGSLWASIGGAIALAELSQAWGKPQFVFSGVVTAAFRKRDDKFDLSAQTFDGRFAIAMEWAPSDAFRFAVGVAHVSGHIADGMHDQTLGPPNLGEDQAYVRVVRDFGTTFRVGATIRPVLHSDPPITPINADQFFEWFPGGARDGATGKPYLAVGVEEMGTDAWVASWHVQAGYYFGTHFEARKEPTVRMTVGYYRGLDPRLKYARFRGEQVSFPYAGVALNL